MNKKQTICGTIFFLALIVMSGESETPVLIIKSVICLAVMIASAVIGKLGNANENGD